jgi:iron complex outermembrane receptor protein
MIALCRFVGGTRKSLFFGASILALSFANAPAFAQAEEEQVERRDLDVVYVTARRTEERLQDVPVAVSAFGAEALERGGVQRLEDLQKLVPGFQATPSARGDASPLYMIRGQRGSLLPSSIVDSSVSVYFDEFNLSRSVGTNQSLFDLASVQVLKGPQGTLFGRNATGGAILLTPNKPTYEVGGYLQAAAGNFDLLDVEGVFNTPLIADKLALRVGGKISRRDGYLTNVLNGQVANDKDAESYRLSLLFTPNDEIESETIGSYYRSTGVGFAQKLDLVVPQSVPIPPAVPAFVAELAATKALDEYEFRNPTELYGVDETTTIQNTTAIKLGEAGILGDAVVKNIVGFRAIENEFVQDFFGGGLNVYPLLGAIENDIFSEELQLQGTKGSLDYILGAYYFHEDGFDMAYGNQFSFLAPVIPARFPINNGYLYDYKNTSLAAFAHANFDLSSVADGLSVSAGIRVTDDTRKIDWHNQPATDPSSTAFVCALTGVVYQTRDPSLCSFKDELSNTEVTYNFSLNYNVAEDFLAYIAHRRGYRAGGFNQTPGPGVPRSFEPEFVDDVELGLKSEFDLFGAPARLNVATYYQWYEDIQRGFSVRTPTGATTNITSNAAKAHIYGLETEFTISPADFLDLSFSHAYTEAVYDE